MIAVAIAVVVTFLLTWYLARRPLRRMKKGLNALRDGVTGFADGDFSLRLRVEGKDEVAALTETGGEGGQGAGRAVQLQITDRQEVPRPEVARLQGEGALEGRTGLGRAIIEVETYQGVVGGMPHRRLDSAMSIDQLTDHLNAAMIQDILHGCVPHSIFLR